MSAEIHRFPKVKPRTLPLRYQVTWSNSRSALERYSAEDIGRGWARREDHVEIIFVDEGMPDGIWGAPTREVLGDTHTFPEHDTLYRVLCEMEDRGVDVPYQLERLENLPRP